MYFDIVGMSNIQSSVLFSDTDFFKNIAFFLWIRKKITIIIKNYYYYYYSIHFIVR